MKDFKLNGMMLTRLYMALLLGFCCLAGVGASGVSNFTTSVTANGHTYKVHGVRVDLKDSSVSVKLGLAWGRVGRTDALAGIAKQYHAVAAINGSFFDAYTSDSLKNPDMTLITDGQVVFKSNIGSLLGFKADNTPLLAHVRYRMWGTLRSQNGQRREWHAYWLNRKPTASPCVTMFTRHWGATVAPMSGTSVVVNNKVVTAITDKEVTIPENGYVVHIRGEAKLLSYFHVGDQIEFAPQMDLDGAASTDWSQVREAVGGGPIVLANGNPIFYPDIEGFTDPKVLQRSGQRSGVGFTSDNVLYLITTSGARVCDLGHILKALGCVQGINLDGGASSCLWYRGKYLTPPGRQISNGLCVIER